MKNIVLFKTANGNCYLYSILKKQFLILDDTSFYILKEYEKERTLEDIIKNDLAVKLNSSKIDNYKKKINYYLAHYNDIDSDFRIVTEIKASEIETQLSNNPSITFEVTERCNLECKYCCYNDYYEGYKPRRNKDLKLSNAKNVIDYVCKHVLSHSNSNYNRYIHINYYGGEPLINFKFISEIVKYTKTIEATKGIIFHHSMTTNAVLLNNHMEFLVENNFHLLISIDGNKFNNSLRVLKNGLESFDSVFKNILLLKENHPEFFKNNVNFNSVLHKNNSVTEIVKFTKKHFDQIANISFLSYDALKEEKKAEFKNKYENINYNPPTKKNCNSLIYNEYVTKTPEYSDAIYLVFRQTNLVYSDYINLLSNNTNSRMLSATCTPFWKKVFVTTQGNILPCENVKHEHSFGKVLTNSVNLNLDTIATSISNDLKLMFKTCKNCYNLMNCEICLFNIKKSNGNFDLSCFCTKRDVEERLGSVMTYIENNENTFKRIITEVSLM